MSAKNKASWIIWVVVLVVIAAAGWFFVSPLFIDEPVDEELPFAIGEPAGFPTRAEVDAMSVEQRAEVMEQVMAAAAAMPDHEMQEPMAAEQPSLLRRGQFEDADAIHKGQGDALLYRLADGSHLLRFENFRVTNGPALVVYLAQHPAPGSAGEVKMGGFVALGKLKGNVGAQNYVIPADVDVTGYGSAVIWCELFDVLFSPASLR